MNLTPFLIASLLCAGMQPAKTTDERLIVRQDTTKQKKARPAPRAKAPKNAHTMPVARPDSTRNKYNMPVMRPGSRNTDRMPIAKPADTSVNPRKLKTNP